MHKKYRDGADIRLIMTQQARGVARTAPGRQRHVRAAAKHSLHARLKAQVKEAIANLTALIRSMGSKSFGR